MTLVTCLILSVGDVCSQSTVILVGGEETELSNEGVISGGGSSLYGGLGAALLDTFNIYYQPLGEGDFQDNLFPDPDIYSFQMNIPEGLPNYQSHGVHEDFWDSQGRNGEGILPWTNEEWRRGQYYDDQYLPAGEESPFGLVSDTVQWTIDYWSVDEGEEVCFIHTCLAGMVEDFVYNEETGDATALLVTLQTAYLGYGEDDEPGPGAVEYEGGVYQGFDSFHERSGLIDHPAYFFQYNGETNEGSLTPCGTKVSVRGEIGIKGYYETIQDAIDATKNGDTVLVHSGVYEENLRIENNIVLASLVLITGNREFIDSTVIDGNEQGSVISIESDGVVNILGFTIRNGLYLNGGGINILRSDIVHLRDLVISENVCEQFGGGICGSRDSNVILNGVGIRGNRSGFYGGGASFEGNENIIEDCSFTHNTAQGDAGALRVVGRDLVMNRVLAANNDCRGYANVKISSMNAQLNHLTIVDNTARAMGGILTRCDISNSILRGNSGYQALLFGEDNQQINITYCDIEDGEDGISVPEDVRLNFENNIDEEPLFVNPEEGDYHLSENSPCIDTGDPDSEPDPDRTRADIGAFYYHQEGEFVNPVSRPFDHNRIFGVYPNPFNSTTTIEYSLPYSSEISLNIYNLSGQRVETFVNGRLQAGIHKVTLDARNTPSGLYFVKLEGAGQTQNQKIMLLK